MYASLVMTRLNVSHDAIETMIQQNTAEWNGVVMSWYVSYMERMSLYHNQVMVKNTTKIRVLLNYVYAKLGLHLQSKK